MKVPNKIMVVRPDRMGDVILSIPSLLAIKNADHLATVSFFLREPIASLMKVQKYIDSVFVYEPSGKHKGFSGLFTLIGEIKKLQLDQVIFLNSSFKISLAFLLARVKKRVGNLSKWYSFLFYTEGIRQNRSESVKNEAQYGLDLVKKSGFSVGDFYCELSLPESALLGASEWLKAQNLSQIDVLIHPGMGGSALNVNFKNYLNLSKKLQSNGHQVVFSVGPLEDNLAKQIKEELPQVPIFEGGGLVLDFLRFAGIIKNSTVVIAPSTGPLHLAAALGARVIGFYPPIQVQRKLRWGPYIRSKDHQKIFSPKVNCPAKYSCVGSSCEHYPCMEMLVTQDKTEIILAQIKKWIYEK